MLPFLRCKVSPAARSASSKIVANAGTKPMCDTTTAPTSSAHARTSDSPGGVDEQSAANTLCMTTTNNKPDN